MTAANYHQDGRPVSGDDFYAVACDPRRSVAVEACAGSGKTWLLVSRIIRALLDGAQAHEILAITFTRKAAGEMRERLHKWLSDFARADSATLRRELHMRGLPDADEAVVSALGGLHRSVLLSGRPVQIRTFHSWFAALLGTAPLAVLQRLELPASYELLEDDALAVAAVWRRFHAHLLGAPQRLADYQALVSTHGRHQTEQALRAALSRRVEFALADSAGRVDDGVKTFAQQFPAFAGLADPLDLLRQPGSARALLQAAARCLGRASAVTFSAAGGKLEQGLTEDRMDDVFSALLTDKGTPRKFSDKVPGLEQVRQAQELVLQVLAACRQHEAWLFQQRLARLSRVLLAEFAELKRVRGWVDMNDIERAAQVMLADPVLSGWVQERLDGRTRHLLIDEFQDTSPLQWQALYAWLSSYAGDARAPGVFIVGDPKQSIYRFRRAEPQVFKAAQAFVADGLGGVLLQCDHTRRNAHAVTDLVNQVMGTVGAAGGYADFRVHTTGSQEAGEVGRLPQILRSQTAGAAAPQAVGDAGNMAWRDSLTQARVEVEEQLRTLEARQAALWIASRIQAGVRPADVMVLSRKRERLSAVQEELRRLRVPVQQPEKTELIEAPEVQDVVALLDVLVSPQHDLSLARALKSPLFNAGDDDLVTLALLQRETGGSWWDVVQGPLQQLAGLSGVLATLAPRLLQYRTWVDQLPPHDALDLIYHHADVLACFGAAAPAAERDGVLSNLRALLAAALQIDGARYATPYGLIRALKATGVKAPASINPAAVQLLTIHGAKGLEAPIVLLLDTDTPARAAESMSVLIDWPGAQALPTQFVFIASESRPPACAEDLLARERQEREREEFNALYVALTRARGQLVLSSVEPHREAGVSWWQRLMPLLPPLAAADAQALVAVAPPASFSMPDLPAAPPADPARGAGLRLVAESTLASRIGQAMHRLLEWGDVDQPPLAALGREFKLGEDELAQALGMARRIRTGAAAWAWDEQVLAWQGDEVELQFGGALLRIDRLVQRRDDGQWWVLDYKSASDPSTRDDLVDQLRNYGAAVRAAHPGQTVRMAFISGQGLLSPLD
jgi:ATP-dependent helicase/nuclease subunit A